MTVHAPIILKNYEEAVGVPRRLVHVNGGLVADFGTFSVLLPPELEADLRPLLGERIGILRTDTSQAYRVRTVKR
jgi:hypothetical protein